MEFSGDETKIQALFSELSLEQQSRTPSFEKLWLRAQVNSSATPRFVTRLAIVTSSILVVVCLIATWSLYTSSQFEQTANIPPQIIPTTSSSARTTQPELARFKDV